MKILPSITTFMTPDWSDRIKQLDELGIKEMALFLTSIKLPERKKLYELLKQTQLKIIPHVHLRDDMEPWELDWLVANYQTKLFNIHANQKFARLIEENQRHIKKIYVENGTHSDGYFLKILKLCAGLCLDFSHLAVGLKFELFGYDQLLKLMDLYKIGCAHVSAFVPEGRKKQAKGDICFFSAPHDFQKLSELDYLLQFKKYLPEYVSLELVNPLTEQLQAREYLQKLLA